jgi:hypothetical protein
MYFISTTEFPSSFSHQSQNRQEQGSNFSIHFRHIHQPPLPSFLPSPFSLPKIIYTYKNENRSHRDQTKKKKKKKTRQAPPTQRRRKPVCDRCNKKRMYNSKAKRKKKAREESNFGFQRSPTPKKKEKKKHLYHCDNWKKKKETNPIHVDEDKGERKEKEEKENTQKRPLNKCQKQE